jgi:lysine 2,3-aminomutase
MQINPSERAPVFKDIPEEKWNDWRWQLSHRLNAVEDFAPILTLTESERKALNQRNLFRVDITPYFVSLIDPGNPEDPIRKQIIPTAGEIIPFTGEMEDSLAEDAHSPVPGLVHRYPDRVLMLVTNRCASYCRYCTRSRIVGDPTQSFNSKDFEAQIDYIRHTPQIRDVLLSGGDPLTLSPKVLNRILSALKDIPHVEIIRIGSRVPVFLPQRVTDDLCELLSQFHPLWLNIHVNHPNEITVELAEACEKLSKAGIPLGNQSVLLAGINDDPNIQRALVHGLVQMRVRPYYLYQCDLVQGAGHFRTPIGKGIEIIESLRGHTSGFAVPTYVVDAPGGGGKIPLNPNYVLSYSDHKVVLRNYEGYITSYEEPFDYQPISPALVNPFRQDASEPGQSGVYGLLEGEKMFLKPEGFDLLHQRGSGMHRLREDKEKWQPRGIGDGRKRKE